MKTNTDYAVNKMNPDAIVYKFSDGTTSILTKADFASEEEFRKWKAISDNNLHETELSDKRYERLAVSLDAADFDGNNPGVEDEYFVDDKISEMNQLCERVQFAFSKCTEIQQRRLCKYSFGKSFKEISNDEEVNVRTVFESIEYGKSKFKKYF